ncbi:unnamed protein product [Schistosoma curassoni]|uniref:Uncharacterized protein n=1 Tax=Schistosoma curassoni TaxID=6186 RepID=A0A183L765_9TREM|nr:unnamed protein product [Schistosoma curassoni]
MKRKQNTYSGAKRKPKDLSPALHFEVLKVSRYRLPNFEVESDPPEVPVYRLGCVSLSKVSRRRQKVISLTLPAEEDNLCGSRREETLVLSPGGPH